MTCFNTSSFKAERVTLSCQRIKAVMALAWVLERQTSILQHFSSRSTDPSVQPPSSRGSLSKINIPRDTRTASRSLTAGGLSLRPRGLQLAVLLGIANSSAASKEYGAAHAGVHDNNAHHVPAAISTCRRPKPVLVSNRRVYALQPSDAVTKYRTRAVSSDKAAATCRRGLTTCAISARRGASLNPNSLLQKRRQIESPWQGQ